MSSPLAEGPADEKVDPVCDFVSVEALPLRFRLMYFSIASASRSRIRVAIGDRAAAGLCKGATGGPGEETENVPVLLAEDMFPEVLGVWPLLYEVPLEYGEGWEGDGDDDADSVDCPSVPKLLPS
jgi:hypothetical protein